MSNWYRDWLFRTLGPIDLRIGADPDVVYPIVLSRLEADAIVKRVEGPDGQDRHAWLVEPHCVIVSTRTAMLACSSCGHNETWLAECVKAQAGAACSRIGCVGHMAAVASPARRALRRSLTSDRNHRVVAREHTGILETDDRLRIETGFIKDEFRWAPNLISATPTLEMGIDIGDLSTLLLSSIPPEEANYVQRIGRSGRRDGNALNMALANARAHDIQFWEDPTPMLAGQVKPPGVFLAAEAVLLRQVTAFSLDAYVAATKEGSDYGKVREVLKRRRDGVTRAFPVEWLELVQARGHELADAFLFRLPEEVRARSDLAHRIRDYLTQVDARSIGWRIGSVFDEAAEERAKLLEKREELTRELERLRRRRAEFTDEEFARREADISRDRTEINRVIRTGIDDVPVLKFLTDKGILPNYAFPEEGVKLTSILSRRNDGQQDEDGLLYLEYTRPASSALSEFAPGQFFYANGRQVQIQRIEIGRDDLSAWSFCPSCSYVSPRHELVESPACPKCGDEMWSDTGSHHEVVRLRSVISVDSEDKSVIRDLDQRQQQQFDRVMAPHYDPENITASWFTSDDGGAPFGFEFVANCTFRDFNFGRKTAAPMGPKIAGERRPSHPFRICRHCGTLQKSPRDETDQGTHPPNCPVARADEIPRASWETEAFLMRSFETEAIRVVIPVVGQMDDDDIKSFVAAINLGMRRYFAGKVDHIRSNVAEAQLDGLTTVRSLYLYDSVPGGSGYLRQIGEHPETMRAVLTRAAEALRDCPCNRDERTGCYRCVKSYRSQFGPGEPDRDRARALMESILQKWNSLKRTETGIDNSIRGALVESALEKRFLRALTDAYGEGALTPQVIAGGRRGFVLKAGDPNSLRLWTIEPQVHVATRFRGLPSKRVDFLASPIGQAGVKPVVIEMDGVEYHAGTVDRDLLDRMTMIRSGAVQVWTLAWKDLDAIGSRPRNPLDETALDAGKIGRLARVLANPDFSALSRALKELQTSDSFSLLRHVLDGESAELAASRSVLVRSLVGTGQALDDLPRAAGLSAEGRLFLMTPGLSAHVGDGGLDLYMACAQVSPQEWKDNDHDLRLLLRGALPDPGEAPAAKSAYTDSWRGLWRLVNLFQNLRGFHVEIEGLDTLSPPDMSVASDETDGRPNGQAWMEARVLCDETFLPLIEALVAAGAPGPNLLGDDLLVGGRVVGMMEFGWSEQTVAVTEEDPGGTGWTLIRFDPGTDGLGDTVTKILQALERAQP